MFYRFIIIICFLLCSCANFRSEYGHFVKLSEIKLGYNKEQLEDKIGKPSHMSEDHQTWYYISTQVTNSLINPRYTSKVIQITFDDKDKIKDINEREQKESTLPTINTTRTQRNGISADKSIAQKIIDGFRNLRPSFPGS